MALTAREPQGDGEFQKAPEGTHVARCYRLIDLGTQYSEAWDKWQPKVLVGWELCDEMMEDDRPYVISQIYTNSLHEKAKLRQHLEAWRGKRFTQDELNGFDLRNVLDKPCLVTVVHNEGSNGKVYANVASVTSLPKGTNAPGLQNKAEFFDIDNPDPAVFDGLSDGLKERINKSRERSGGDMDEPPPHEDGEDIPF